MKYEKAYGQDKTIALFDSGGKFRSHDVGLLRSGH